MASDDKDETIRSAVCPKCTGSGMSRRSRRLWPPFSCDACGHEWPAELRGPQRSAGVVKFRKGGVYFLDGVHEFYVEARTGMMLRLQPKFGAPFHCKISVNPDGVEEARPFGPDAPALLAAQ